MTTKRTGQLQRLRAATAVAAGLALASTASAQYGTGYYDDDYDSYDQGYYGDDYGYDDTGYWGTDADRTFYGLPPRGDPGYIGLYEEDPAWDDPYYEAGDAFTSPEYRWGYYDPQEREGYPMYWWDEDNQRWVRSTGDDAWTGSRTGTATRTRDYDSYGTGAQDRTGRARYYDIDMYVIDPQTGERRPRTTGDSQQRFQQQGMQNQQQQRFQQGQQPRFQQNQQQQYQRNQQNQQQQYQRDRQRRQQDQQMGRQMGQREDTVGGRNSSMRQQQMQQRQQRGMMMQGQQARQNTGGQARLSGEISDTRRVSLRNTQGQSRDTTLLRVQLQNGRSEIIDIGPQYSAQDLNLSQGDQITVSGQRQTINGRPVIKAQTIRIDGERFNVQGTRQQGQQGQQQQWRQQQGSQQQGFQQRPDQRNR